MHSDNVSIMFKELATNSVTTSWSTAIRKYWEKIQLKLPTISRKE